MLNCFDHRSGSSGLPAGTRALLVTPLLLLALGPSVLAEPQFSASFRPGRCCLHGRHVSCALLDS